eukprot:CAMPEP_0169414750 /NCGR_PEP_ID=MMETSP1017-20121227/62142_1 /TAXON_ID=342587 /ORGANISM="Karlodinium micrum, Strain CCMP2283" /LENGTH=44 /DNA_ID= /DNA_START= /DNA_END= /DNA_ORIENTATION=
MPILCAGGASVETDAFRLRTDFSCGAHMANSEDTNEARLSVSSS